MSSDESGAECAASIALALVLVYLIISLGLLSKEPYGAPPNTIPVRGPDDLTYWIQEDLNDHEKAAAIMAELHQRLLRLMKFIKRKYGVAIEGGEDTVWGKRCPERVRQAREFLVRFNPDVIYETNPDNPNGDTSFVISKGLVMSLCLRKRNDPTQFHDINLLMFTLVHEASHILSPTYQHEREFWSTMKWMLKEAEEAGVIKLIDYSKHPTQFCGVPVRFSPAFDSKIPMPCEKS
jgi:hypothetical protein